ncbi:hypothetical protein HER21_16725 [Pseudomonas sp. BGM005]|nr:hypothetical protein [Pseudomonas sp. BG5]
MSRYFDHLADQLASKISQAKVYITKHNPSTGALAEAVLREFLQEHLPGQVRAEQGFILSPDGGLSKQCDILIYDAHRYAPFYRAGATVVVPVEAVIAVIEVKTSINKRAFEELIKYFEAFDSVRGTYRTYLFMFNAPQMGTLSSWFHSYPHPDGRTEFDHDTFCRLPDEITGLDSSYHLKKDMVIDRRDGMGYLSYFYHDQEGTAINALELFYLSVYSAVEDYVQSQMPSELAPRAAYHRNKISKQIEAIDLFPM